MGQPIASWCGVSSPRKRARSNVGMPPLHSNSVGISGAAMERAVAIFGSSDDISSGVDRFEGLDRDVVSDVAAFYAGLPAEDSPRRGCLDIVRVRRDRPPFLQRRRATSTLFCDEEEDDDGDALDAPMDRSVRDGLAIIYVDTVDGVCWELGCWPELRDPTGSDVFQIVLDVLTETVGTCSVAKLRVRDNLHFIPGIGDGLDLLRHVAAHLPDDSMPRTGLDCFVHPITDEAIEIILAH